MSLQPIDPHTLEALTTQWGAHVVTLSLKAFVLLAMALALNLALRRGPAAARHLVWTCAVAGLLALPALGLVLPGWSVPGLDWSTPVPANEDDRPSPTFVGVASTSAAARGDGAAYAVPIVLQRSSDAKDLPATYLRRSDEPPAVGMLATLRDEDRPPVAASTADAAPVALSPRAWSAWTWALMIWELGVLLVVGWLSIGWLHLRALRRRSAPIGDPEWNTIARAVAAELRLARSPRLLRVDANITPLTWGVLRPVVLVPASADDWTHERRVDVLRHEFAHVQRRDVLTQLLAQIACALFWFHPLPWIAAAHMRLERERACDDRVLLAGSRASSYAGHLLDMARSLRSEHSLAAATIGMARRSQLGERMDSILDDAPRGRRLGPVARGALVTLVLLALVPLAALRPNATQAAPPERDDFPELVTPAPGAPARLWRSGHVRAFPSAPALSAGIVGRVAPAAPGDGFELRRRPGAFAVGAATLGFGRGGVLVDVDGDYGDDYEIDADRSDFRMRDDDVEFEVEMDGRIRFAEDESDVEWMEPGAHFELFHEVDRERRRVEIEADRDGEIERTYWVGRERREFDDEASAWLAEVLPQFLMRAGIGTVPRVRRWVGADGVDGAIERIRDLDSDFVAARHWSALIGLEDLSSDDRGKALDAMATAIDSDFEKSQVLGANVALLLDDPALGDDVVVVLESMDSDFERRRVLESALSLQGLDEDTLARLLVVVGEMDSDFEKIEALRRLPRDARSGERLQRAYLEALRGVDSDFERARGLKIFLEDSRGVHSAPLFLDTVRGIESDFERAGVLIEALPLALDDEEARGKMWESIAEMDSDFEQARVIGALRDRVSQDEGMLLEALDAIARVDGDHEKGQLLLHYADAAARYASTREKYVDVAESLDGDHAYGQVLRALRRAER